MKLVLDSRKVRREMKRLGLNQVKVAKRWKQGGASRQAVNRALRTRNPKSAIIFARIFKCDPKDLLITLQN
jgi:hypothetical protein